MKHRIIWAALGAVLLALPAVALAESLYLPAVQNGASFSATPTAQATVAPTATANPGATPRVAFIHHSCGSNWLRDGLRDDLNAAGYFAVDVSYGWGPADQDAGSGAIGDHTDIGHWYNWFVGPHRDAYLSALYATDSNAGRNSGVTDPGGENSVIMFKACYPNSALGGHPDDPATVGANPLRGQGSGSRYHTVANAKGIYNDLLGYFSTRPDKLFVVVTAPPLAAGSSTAEEAANARAFNRWLVQEWLSAYPLDNVFVFDFYNVLTSNGGDPATNDLGAEAGNHHRYRSGVVEYVADQGSDFLAYPTGDSHPSAAGNEKAAAEFVPLLDLAVSCRQGRGGCDLLAGKGHR